MNELSNSGYCLIAKYNKGGGLMLKVIANYIILVLSCSSLLMAQSADSPANLDQYEWKTRVVLIFADSKESRRYQKQLKEFAGHNEGLQDRDLISLHLFANGKSFSKGQDISSRDVKKLREQFKIESSSFIIILLGKDGNEKFRQQEVLSTDNLFNVIDAMPMRQR